MNYDIFFPIQIYRFQSHIRLECPSLQLSTPQEYIFHPHFMDGIPDLSDDEREKLKRDWVYDRTIWTFNPKYAFHASKATGWILVIQENTHSPYATSNIFVAQSKVPAKISLVNAFVFGFYIYPIPDTFLCFMSIDNKTYRLLDMQYSDHEHNTISSYKDAPFYDIPFYDKHVFAYVFHQKPTGKYWSTWNQICVPTTSPHGFKTLSECLHHSIDDMHNRSTYLGDPLTDMTSFFTTRSSVSILVLSIAIIGSAIAILLLLVLVIQRRRSFHSNHHNKSTVVLNNRSMYE
jgi:hypothetical protein